MDSVLRSGNDAVTPTGLGRSCPKISLNRTTTDPVGKVEASTANRSKTRGGVHLFTAEKRCGISQTEREVPRTQEII